MWLYGAVIFYYLVITEEGFRQADSTAHMAAALCGQSAHKNHAARLMFPRVKSAHEESQVQEDSLAIFQ